MTAGHLVVHLSLLALLPCATQAARRVPVLAPMARQAKGIQEYYDEEIYYDAREEEREPDFDSEINIGEYADVAGAKAPSHQRQAIAAGPARVPADVAKQEQRVLQNERAARTKAASTTGCEASEVTRTTKFCSRSLENAKETVRFLNDIASRSSNHGWQLVCRLVSEYAFCVSEMLSECRDVRESLKRQVAVNVRAEGLGFCLDTEGRAGAGYRRAFGASRQVRTVAAAWTVCTSIALVAISTCSV
ncbi:uncharacterized protein LOC144163392 [Haemaphysalis longicornis]